MYIGVNVSQIAGVKLDFLLHFTILMAHIVFFILCNIGYS